MNGETVAQDGSLGRADGTPAEDSHLPRVAVVVLNWNGLEDTVRCLASLRELAYPALLTVLVDNGSSDGSADRLAEMYPECSVIRNGRNLGYAEGNNAGIRFALAGGADYVLILNNDTRVDREAVSHLVGAAESDPSIGIASPRILLWDQPECIWYDGARVDPVTMEPGHEGLMATDETRPASLFDTGYASGCAMMVRSDLLRRIGLLDPDYYLVFEEADLSARAWEAGYRVVVVPQAWVWHRVSVSFGGEESPVYLYYYHRNNLLYVLKRLRGWRKLRGLACVARRQAHYVWHLYRTGRPGAGLRRRVMGRALGDFLLRRWGEGKGLPVS